MEDILKRLNERARRERAQAQAPVRAGAAAGRVFATFMGTDAGLGPVLDQIAALTSAGIPIQGGMSASGARIIGKGRVEGAGVSPVWDDESQLNPLEVARSYDAYLVPALTLNGLSKLAQVTVDSFCSIMLVEASRRNVPIIVVRDGIFSEGLPVPTPASGLGRKVEGFFNELKAMGMTVVTGDRLAQAVTQALGMAPGSVKAPRPSLPAPVVGQSMPYNDVVSRPMSFEPSPRPLQVTIGGGGGGQAKPSVATMAKPALPASSGPRLYSPGGGSAPAAAPKPAAPVARVTAPAAPMVSKPARGNDASLAGLIDHTLLKPNATPEQVDELCDEAREYKFATVCVNPGYVQRASQRLKGSGVGITTVIGFPLGQNTPAVKAAEAREALAKGATEIDMVINVGALKAGDYKTVFDDIRAVRLATSGHVLKVILETALLSDEEIVAASQLSKEAQADFVKTSTGFSTGGATKEHIALMRKTVGPDMGVKASGGVRTADDAWTMVEAGATRIGASSSVDIVTGGTGADGY